jgi:hypothetical protein
LSRCFEIICNSGWGRFTFDPKIYLQTADCLSLKRTRLAIVFALKSLIPKRNDLVIINHSGNVNEIIAFNATSVLLKVTQAMNCLAHLLHKILFR